MLVELPWDVRDDKEGYQRQYVEERKCAKGSGQVGQIEQCISSHHGVKNDERDDGINQE